MFFSGYEFAGAAVVAPCPLTWKWLVPVRSVGLLNTWRKIPEGTGRLYLSKWTSPEWSVVWIVTGTHPLKLSRLTSTSSTPPKKNLSFGTTPLIIHWVPIKTITIKSILELSWWNSYCRSWTELRVFYTVTDLEPPIFGKNLVTPSYQLLVWSGISSRAPTNTT